MARTPDHEASEAMKAAELLRIQLELECIGEDADGLLVRIPGAHPDGVPRFYAAEHAEDRLCRCSHEVPPEVRAELLALPFERARDDAQVVCRLLAQHAPCAGIWRGRSYVFPAAFTALAHDGAALRLTERETPLIERFDAELLDFPPPVFAVVVDGEIVSACVSSRENTRAGEAWVQTAPAYRGRGYARQVTAAWGASLVRRGKIAFYSHAQENAASAAVARGLGLEHYLTDTGYS